MSTCNCSNISSDAVIADQANEQCKTTVHETVCVQGTVTITPSLVSGTSESFCVGNPVIGNCEGDLKPKCEFTVSQRICVQIPLTFSATASAVANGVVCGTPETGLCPGATEACVHTIGFFKNHEDVRNALIAAAGGSILLGAGGGLTLTATKVNAFDILDLNPPAPAPQNPPFAGQYANLYAQLLAAKLNVLTLQSQGFAVCQFILDAIKAADNFIASSPAGGTTGASGFGDPLEQFNSGNATEFGCPPHCRE